MGSPASGAAVPSRRVPSRGGRGAGSGGAGAEGQAGAGGCCGRPGKAVSAAGGRVGVRGWVLPGGAGAATCLRLAPKPRRGEGQASQSQVKRGPDTSVV